jgi:hypothetical protein
MSTNITFPVQKKQLSAVQFRPHRYYWLLLLAFLFASKTMEGQLPLVYEREISDFYDQGFGYYNFEESPRVFIQTETGNALYLGRQGTDINITLRDNNTVLWRSSIKTLYSQADQRYFTFDSLYQVFEHSAGYYFFGQYHNNAAGTGTPVKFMGRLNKNTGNLELFVRMSLSSTSQPWEVIESFGGRLVFVGSIGSGSSKTAYIEVQEPNGSIYLTKSSHGGGGIWGNEIRSIAKTQDNGYIISGKSGNNWWLCKLNSAMDVVWSRNMGIGFGNEQKVIVLENNDIVSLHSIRIDPFFSTEESQLIRLDPNGNIILTSNLNSSFVISDIQSYCNNQFISTYYYPITIWQGSRSFVGVYGLDLNHIEDKVILNNECGFCEEGSFNTHYYDFNEKTNSFLILRRYYQQYFPSEDGTYKLVKTTHDPACSYNPPTGCSGLSGGFTRYSDCESFDAFQSGNLVPQASPRFTLFSNQSYEHAQVTTERAFSGNKSLKFTATSDIDFNIERMIQSPTRLEWMTYLPAGKTGSWALETIPNNPEALFIEWNNGNATVYVYENNVWVGRAYFTYTPGTWFRTALIFNNSRNTIELWVGRKLVYTLTNYTSLRITDLNFFATQGSPVNEFYVDDIIYYEIATNISCTSEYNPVCISEKDQEFNNPCFAGLSAYTPNEWTSGPCDGPPPPPPSSLTVDIDNNVCGAAGSIVEVPVRVSGYTGVAALQMIIASSNNSAAEILGVTSINPNTDIASSDFIITGGRLGLAYAFRPNTLANGSVLFSVRVRLNGSAGTNALLTFDGQIVAADNAVNTINAIGLSGSVCISVATSRVGGTISTAASRVMAGVTVRTTSGSTQVNTTLTDTSGNYSVSNLTNGTSYTITPSFSDGLKDGLDVTDMLIMRRHMLGAALFTNGYMYVAADLNFDRVINISDLLILRKIILDEITSLSGGVSPWRFIPSSYAFPSGNPLSGTIPSTLSYNPLNGNQTGQNFTGVKYGDLNNSANFTEMPDDEGRSTGEILLEIPEVSGKPGEEVSVDMRCRGFERGAGMQFSLRWPADELELVAVEANTEGLGGTTWYNEARKDRGVLGVVWESEDVLRGTDVEDGGLCYRLRFRILGSAGTVAEIGVADEGMGSMFVDSDLQRHRMSIQRGVVRVAETSATDEGGWRSAGVYPNPTTGILHLEYGKDTPQAVTLQTMEGTVLRKVSASEKTMDLSDLTAGVYMVKMQFEQGMVSRKVIVIK